MAGQPCFAVGPSAALHVQEDADGLQRYDDSTCGQRNDGDAGTVATHIGPQRKENGVTARSES